MSFTDLFIRRPVVALSVSLLILLIGGQSLWNMSVREYPKLITPVVNVYTGYWGASPEVIRGFITHPLEQAIVQVDDVDYISSSSSLGNSQISVAMKLNSDRNAALANVLSRVNAASSNFPSEAKNPIVTMSAGSGTAIMYIAFSSDDMNPSQINEYLERVIKPQLFSLSGISNIQLYGGIKFGLRVWVDPQRLAAYGISAGALQQAIRRNNSPSAPGRVMGMYNQLNIEANTQSNSKDTLENIVIATRNQQVIRLKDVAKVTLEKSKDNFRALANGTESVIMMIEASSASNPLEVADAVHKELPNIKQQMLNTLEFEILYDATEAIDESIYEVAKTLIEATLIVLIIITLFLGSIRAVLIPVITIPLSLIGVAMLMALFDFTINLMTLLAMVLAIGLVVDDAIVVVENVDRHIRMGKTPYQAAILGTREIALPVISMTLTLAAVYAPIAFIGGLTGSLFKEFALTLGGAVFISGIVALTLSPMMCSQWLKPHSGLNTFQRRIEQSLNALTKGYQQHLQAFMENRLWVLLMAAGVLASLPLLFSFIPEELAPSEDRGGFMILGMGSASANLDNTQSFMQEAGDKIKTIDEVNSWLAAIGSPTANNALGVVTLKPWNQRETSQADIIEQASMLIGDVSGVSLSAFPFPELPGSTEGMPLQLVINTPNSFASLLAVSDSVLKEMRTSPKFIVSHSSLAFDTGTLNLLIDRDKAGAYGVTVSDIATTLNTMLNDHAVNRVSIDGASYDVIGQVARWLRLNPEHIHNYYVRSPKGAMIPLKELINFELAGQPKDLTSFNQMNSAIISAVPAPGITMGDAIKELETITQASLPKNFNTDYLGPSRQFIQEGNALYWTFALALAVIFLVLAIQFNSLRDPLVILVSVPLAISGALTALAWGASTLNIYSQVGLVTLVGLISKHGILICEVAKHAQITHNKSPMEAVIDAAEIRLRPILMTTSAMIAGLIPLLFAEGPGAQSRFSIGIVIIAGLAIGTLFTLFVLPVIYSFIASKHQALPAKITQQGETAGTLNPPS